MTRISESKITYVKLQQLYVESQQPLLIVSVLCSGTKVIHVYLFLWSNNGVDGDKNIKTFQFRNTLLKLEKVYFSYC